jgi:dihydrofolate reductase
MREIVAGLFISLDGVAEAPGTWTFPYFDDEVGQVGGAGIAASDTILLGRRTKAVEWRNSRLITSELAKQITKLKQQPGKNISITGSATLVRSLLPESLLDQLGLLLYPIVLGTGKRLFEDWTEKVPLKLGESQALSNGVLSFTYKASGR